MNWTSSAICYFYFVFVGICYLLGFWTPLYFNVLEFLSPVDIIKSATYPIIPAMLSMFFGVLLDSFNSQGPKKPEANDPKPVRFIFFIIVFCLLLLVLFNIISLASYLYHLYFAEPEKRLSYALPAISMICVFYLISNPPMLKDKHRMVRNFVIIFVCFLPTVAYYQGGQNIKNVFDGKSNFYYLKISSKNCLIDNKSKMIYLGFYSGNYFFVNSVSRDICIERDGGVLMTLSKRKSEPLISDTKDDDSESHKKTQPPEKTKVSDLEAK